MEQISYAAAVQLSEKGYFEVTERGPLGSGKTYRVEEEYPTRNRVLKASGFDPVRGTMFETWLISPN